MNFRKFAVLALLLAATAAGGPLYKNSKAPIDARVEDLLSRMTLKEKVMQMQNIPTGKLHEIADRFGENSYGSTHDMDHNAYDAAVIFKTLAEHLEKNNRWGIPMINCCEGIQGLLQNGCTLFPHAIAQASTWNPALIEEMTSACGREARAIGIRQVLSPVLDVARELRWGRVEETYGEDPFMIAEMAKAFVNGYQGEGVLAMPKHFVAHGSPSGGLNCASVAGGPREFRSIYLYPFRRVIAECKPGAIMSCYSAYDGEPMTGSRYYMTDVLRGELGHTGYCYSDWGSVERIKTFHNAVATPEEAAMQAAYAGIDINTDWTYQTLVNSVREGKLSEEVINTNVRRILRAKFMLGLFEDSEVNPDDVKKVVRSKEHVALAKRVADESIILAENKNDILPLNLEKYKKIAIVGPNGHYALMGDYAWVRPDGKEGIDLYEGLVEAVGEKATVTYTEGCDWWSQDDSHIPEAVKAVEEADIAIVAVGTRSTFLGRGGDKNTAGEAYDLSSLELPGRQLDLIKAVKSTGKPMIVVFITGKPLVMTYVQENADAALVQFCGGEQQGAAMADVLLGNVNPSGKLTVSFPRSTGNTPCFYNHYLTDRDFWDQPGTPADPKMRYIFDIPQPVWNFGHGLSYTTFEYSGLEIDNKEPKATDTIIVKVTVTNIGDREGKEVVQLYVRDIVSSVSTPVQQLKGFEKVSLKPGESRVVELKLPIKELALWNAHMEEVVEPGDFELQIGSASDDIKLREIVTVK
ncbi:MAG: glycoside hydrolase family 3 C-terminal domain-containing protein [Muribaculaceae bacterium]|nr:glycoside hydrolase family 3 C-terminal domain-containing protein [Muribaculaceae bacterium]